MDPDNRRPVDYALRRRLPNLRDVAAVLADQVPQAVADAVSRCLLTTNANLGGYFETTIAAQAVVDEAHHAGAPAQAV